MGIGHTGHLYGQYGRPTDTTKNITFLQLPCWRVTSLLHFPPITSNTFQDSNFENFLNEWNVNFLCQETFKSTIIVENTVKCQIYKF